MEFLRYFQNYHSHLLSLLKRWAISSGTVLLLAFYQMAVVCLFTVNYTSINSTFFHFPTMDFPFHSFRAIREPPSLRRTSDGPSKSVFRSFSLHPLPVRLVIFIPPPQSQSVHSFSLILLKYSQTKILYRVAYRLQLLR